MAGEPRRPWYERFGGIGGSETPTQSLRETGIPVPAGGTFQGRRPPKERRSYEQAPDARLEERWSAVSRCDRTAEVTEVSWLTRTGTLRLAFEVTDDRPFKFEPGNFVRIETEVEGKGFRRGTYCIASAPSDYRRFELLVRVVPGGRMSSHLGSLRLGEGIAFRGPTGRSMVRAAGAGDADLVLVGTGVGIAPLLSLSTTLLRGGWRRRIDLYWGLRLPDDVCLTAELDRLADRYGNFGYRISLSQPPDDWAGITGLRGRNAMAGRVTESVPPLVADVNGKRFLLAGNGAMIEELAAALRELGVHSDHI
ncbi:MAG: ferredoxin--NADP reductase [Acidimicrobiia bacterium]